MKIRCPGRPMGMEFTAYLPPGYESHPADLRLMVWDDKRILVTHPMQPPRWIDRETGELTDLTPLERLADYWPLRVNF